MKEKILLAIKAKFPAINLSKKRLDAIAAKIEAIVIDDETKIDAALTSYNDFNPLADIAKADDKIRDLEAKVKAAKKEEPVQPEPAKPEPEFDENTPSWVKVVIEQNKKIAADLAIIQGEKVANAIIRKATEKLKDVPVSYWGKRSLPDKEDGLDAFVTEVTADYTQFKQEMTDAGLSVLATPKAGGSNGVAGKTKATDKEVQEVINNIM